MDSTIRPAQHDDAAISAVILRALRETNAKDYTDEIIARVERTIIRERAPRKAVALCPCLRRKASLSMRLPH